MAATRFLIVTDIHANLPALAAVLQAAKGQYDRLISLGDQVNFGPHPRETLALLRAQGAVMLLGNHEARLRAIRQGQGAAYLTQYNWSLLRWTYEQLPEECFDLPSFFQWGPLYFTHGVPGNADKLLCADDGPAICRVLEALPPSAQFLITGHNHIPWDYTFPRGRALNPGSLGMLEKRGGRLCGYALAWEEKGDWRIEPRLIPYDASSLKSAYLASGAAQAAPEFARLALEVMLTGENGPLDFIRLAREAALREGLDWTSRESFRLAASRFPWREPLPCDAFWQEGEM